MDFDNIKTVVAVNYASHATPPKSGREAVNTDAKNNSATVKEDNEIAKAKDILYNLISDSKENSNQNNEEQDKVYSDKEIETMIKAANEKLVPIKRSFEYSIHEKTKRMTIKIFDGDTKELIKEIPPEKMQNALAKMWELAGLIVDEKR